MNGYPPHDLQALEARLREMAPRASLAEQQQLLYRCAFAAGRRVARRGLRSWQGATALLTVLLIGAIIPLAQRSSRTQLLAEQPAQNLTLEPAGAENEIPPLAARGGVAVPLDAWEAKPSTRAAFDDELTQFAQADPRLRSLTVGALTRQLLDQ